MYGDVNALEQLEPTRWTCARRCSCSSWLHGCVT